MTAVICASPVYAGDLTLWYSKPANPGMNEALPIGNGTFGGLIYAGPKRERVVLNEISLWTGTEISTEDYEKMGSYQMLGELLVDLAPDAASSAVQSYRRSLDLATAIHSVTYQSGGVTFQREAFASHPDQVMVLTFSADRPGACTGTVRLQGAHK
jgi:alpha-L-fucosidase 2